MLSFTDQLGRTITLDQPPRRIISLVPSQTELLYTLNANVIGITKFCIHPDAWFRNKPRIGGTRNIDPDKIAALQPDLLIANKEENDRRQVESLAAQYPVWVSDVHDLTDALAMIRAVGELVNNPGEAARLADSILKAFDDLRAPSRVLRTAYLIWRSTTPSRGTPPSQDTIPSPNTPLSSSSAQPSFMAAGGDNFIHDMLRRCGLTNAFADRPRYPTISLDDLASCDLILLSSEPYPFREKDAQQLQSLLPHAAIRLVDGEFFSWYGSRLLHAARYFRDQFFP